MQTIQATEAETDLATLLRRVSGNGEKIVIERDGEPLAALVPIGGPQAVEGGVAAPGSEQRFKDFADASSDWFWEMDEQCRFSYFSDRFTEVTGVPQDALLGKTRAETGIPNVAPREWENHLADLAAHRSFRNFQHPRSFEDGRVVHLSINGKAIFDGQGRFRGYRGTGTDITHRKQAEDALGESEIRYRTLASMAPVGIFHTDVQGQVTYVNEKWCEIGGLKPEEAMGSGWVDALHPEDRERVAAKWNEFARGETTFLTEYRYRRPDGVVAYCYVQAMAETGIDGKIIGYIGTVTDITERKQAEETLQRAHDELEERVEARTEELRRLNDQLRAEEAKLREILENSPVGVAIVSHDVDGTRMTGDRLFVNNALVEMFGAPSRESFLGAQIQDSWVDLDQLKAIEDIFKSRSDLADFEALRRRADGTEWWASMSTRPIRFGGQDCTMVWHFDITERKRAEEALRESTARLQSIMDYSPAMIFLKDAEGRYLLANRRFERSFGIGADAIKGKFPADALPADLAASSSAQDLEIIRTRLANVKEEQFSLEGEEHILLTNKFPILDASGNLTGIGAISSDITERKRAEESLRETEALVHALVAHSPVALSVKDLENRYTYVSPAYTKYLGLAAEEAVGRSASDILPPDVMAALAAADQAVLRSGEPLGEDESFTVDFGPATLLVTKFPVHDDADEIIGIGTVGIDITERKRAEEALKESEARYKVIVEDQTELISRFTPDGRRTFVNQAFCRYVGQTAEELVGTALYDLVPGDQWTNLKAHLAGLTPQSRRKEFENQVLRHDGEYRWFNWIDRAVFDGQDQLIEFQSVGRDITDHKKMEAALRDSEKRYRTIFDNVTAGIGRTLLEDGRVIFSNKKLAQMFGYDSVGEFCSEFVFSEHYVNPEDRSRLMSSYEQFPGTPIECTFTKRDGSHLIVQANALADYEEEVLDFVAIDITEQRQAEDRLRQAQKMEAVGQLTGGVAHDFNNLLAVIMGNAELLEDQLGSEAPPLQAILRSATRGAELTQRLLAFSRRQPLQPQRIDLADLLAGMADLLQRTLGETIAIETVVAPDPWAASADPGQVENALLNLAINARDAMPGGGKLTVECANVRLDEAYVAQDPEAAVGDYALLAVSDTGTGMTPAVRSQAFEPFFTTKDVGEGSGLGLSMVYGFAKQSGGHVTICSESGKGTTVKLYLPRAEQISKKEKPKVAGNVPHAQGEMILVIEDDAEVRSLAVAMLAGLGYRAIDVPDAKSARAVLERGDRVDLVLSDVVLPGGRSGPEFAEEIRSHYPALKVIFMSGYPVVAAKRNGFVGSDRVLLNKPFRKRDLAKVLREALD
jgi:PAS domain S-box-containing protein